MPLRALNQMADRLATALCILGGMGLIFAFLATCWSAIGKFSLRQFNAIWGPETVPAALSWIGPLRGEDELVAFAVCFALFAALPFVTLKRAHISVNLFEPTFGRLGNRILDTLGDGVLLILAYFFMRQQWNLIFKPARTSRGQEPLLGLIRQGDWAQVWDQRFMDSKRTQVMGLEFWPMHVWAEVCSILFFAAALVALLRTLGCFKDLSKMQEAPS